MPTGRPMSPTFTYGRREDRSIATTSRRRCSRGSGASTVTRLHAPGSGVRSRGTADRAAAAAGPGSLRRSARSAHAVESARSRCTCCCRPGSLQRPRAAFSRVRTGSRPPGPVAASPDPAGAHATAGGRTWVLGMADAPPRPDPVLVKALRSAHALIGRDATGGPVIDAIPASPYHRKLMRLAFLAPDLQRAILAGRQPPGSASSSSWTCVRRCSGPSRFGSSIWRQPADRSSLRCAGVVPAPCSAQEHPVPKQRSPCLS